jgi:hypothetical protein
VATQEAQLSIKEVNFHPANSFENDQYGPWAKTRVFFWLDSEKGMLDQLALRHDRPFEEYRKHLPEVFKALGIEPVKARWSQKAGCSCPCSPGFVLDVSLGGVVWVTLTGRDEVAEKQAAVFRETGVIVRRDGAPNTTQLMGGLASLLGQ